MLRLLAVLSDSRRQLIDLPIVRPQLLRQFLRSPQPHRAALDIHQHGRAAQRLQRRPIPQAAIGEDQQALLFSRLLPLALVQPFAGLLQRLDQRGAAAGAELLQPVLQLRRGLLPLPQPAWLCAGGVQDGKAGALAVGLLEGLGQQAFGLG